MSFDAGGGTAGGGGVGPSNLHLKKELTQIRKAARALRDPGTSSSPAPLGSARSLLKHRRRGMAPPVIAGKGIVTPSSDQSSDYNVVVSNKNNKGNAAAEKGRSEKTVFLHNWRNQRSGKQILVDENEVSFLSSSSKSDAYTRERGNISNTSTYFTPSIMHRIKKKSKRSGSYPNSIPKPQKRMILVEKSDDNSLSHISSEDVMSRTSTVSPLLARVKIKDSVSYSKGSHHNSKYIVQNSSTVDSWDSINNEVNEEHLEHQGCSYWSKKATSKSRKGYESGRCCSPSIRDSLRRKKSDISGGTRSIHQKRRPKKRRTSSRLPHLRTEDDDLVMNFSELDLESSSRLNLKRWSSSCRSPEEMKVVIESDQEGSTKNARSLSDKHRPLFFNDLVGQNIVVQSLKKLVLRKRVGPVYLFHGPCGTGKTSAVRIFAAALNCLASEENSNKPCGVCRECASFTSGHSSHIVEVNGSNKTDVEKIKNILKSLMNRGQNFSEFKVFVVNECHLLPSKLWLGFLGLVENPLPNVVFVLVTTDIDNLPRSVLSRCQKYVFSKIGNLDIVSRLSKIVESEGLDVEPLALEMIATNADGSLRDAENMLDQLSLFGKRIGASLVNDLIGVVSDEKLLELLEFAISSNATETVIRARELMDSGVDPTVLMSQMATLIVDIIAGVYPSGDGNHNSLFGGRNLSERELDRLKHALNILSEAEKKPQPNWFTATLLHLGSAGPPDRVHSFCSSCRSSKATEDDSLSLKLSALRNSMGKDSNHKNGSSTKNERSALARIWEKCVEKCHSKTLRELLHEHGQIVSITEVEGGFVAYVGFIDQNIRARAEGFLRSITNSFESVLGQNVEVRIVILPDFFPQVQSSSNEPAPSDPTELNQDVMDFILGERMMGSQRNEVVSRWDDHYMISPSSLHSSSLVSSLSTFTKGYESGTRSARCCGMLRWNNSKPRSGNRGDRSSWFGACGKGRRSSRRYNR